MMPGQFLVQISFSVLLENLLMADTSQAWDINSVKDWLHEEGFTEQEDGWLCDEAGLARLDRTEVHSAQRL